MKPAATLVALFVGLLTPRAVSAAETYLADPAHSTLGFSVRNVIVRVSGKFTAFTATVQVDAENPELNAVTAEIPIASIDTGEKKRDHHLQQPEFFDVARYPAMTFQSTRWKKTGGNDFEVAGSLTIRGITKPVILKVRLLESQPDRQRWEAKTTVNRHDYGINAYNRIIGADVDIAITLVTQRKP